MALRPLCVLIAGDPVQRVLERRGGWSSLMRQAVGDAWGGAWLDVDARVEELPNAQSLAGVIITGSSSSVTERAAWMLRAEAWLRSAVERQTPILGVCFGHQLLGQALGGRVDKNPRGREIGSVEVELLDGDPLLDAGIRPYLANATHVDSVVKLPEGTRVLARTELEPHAAVRFANNAYGVQFHPEIDRDVMRDYLEARRDRLAAEGLDTDALIAKASEAPAGRAALVRFVTELVRPA